MILLKGFFIHSYFISSWNKRSSLKLFEYHAEKIVSSDF